MNPENHITRQPLSLIIRNNSDKPRPVYVLGDPSIQSWNFPDVSICVEQRGGESAELYQELITSMDTDFDIVKIVKTMIWCDPFVERVKKEKFPPSLKKVFLWFESFDGQVENAKKTSQRKSNSQSRNIKLISKPIGFHNRYMTDRSGRTDKVYTLARHCFFAISMPPNYCIRLELYASIDSHNLFTQQPITQPFMKSKPQTTAKAKTTPKGKKNEKVTIKKVAPTMNKPKVSDVIKIEREPVVPPISVPMIITAKNASDRTKPIKLFNGDTKSSGNHEFVHVYLAGEDSSDGYDKLMTEIKDQDIQVGVLYISYNNVSKLIQSMPNLIIRYRKNNRIAKKVSLTMDPYQQQMTVLTIKQIFNLNKNVYVEIFVQPDDRITLSFYPKQINDNKK